MTKPKAKRPDPGHPAKKAAPDPAPPSPPEANIPPLDVAIPEEPDHLRKREEAFKRRRGVTR